MNKKFLRILIMSIFYFLVGSIILTNIVDAGFTDSFGGNINGINTTPVKGILSSVLGIIRLVGVFIAVSILLVIATKYMIASAGDRADIKKYAVTYIIGAVILFATSGIAGIAKQFIDAAFETP